MFRKKKKKIKRKKPWWQGWLEAALFALVIVFPLKNYTLQNFMIPSSSMEKTLLIGDYLIANKWKFFFSDPERGDIVTFKNPADPDYPQPEEQYFRLVGPLFWDKENFKFKWQEKKNIVKRVIGMPGDTIRIVDKKVYLNGELFVLGSEQHVDHSNLLGRQHFEWNYDDLKYRGSDVNFGDFDGKIGGFRDNFGPVVVPEKAYFVMGDNRDMSLDSRYWGFLDKKFITGTPSLVVFSRGAPPVNSARKYILLQQGRLREKSEFRWNRTMKIIR